MEKSTLILIITAFVHSLFAGDYYVSKEGRDTNDGSASKPFKTIGAVARIAQPGDVITVYAGTYRERINPPRGGESDVKRIVYKAAQGKKVMIKGSEIVTGWKHLGKGVWKVSLPNDYFGDYNPYEDIIVGDWFDNRGRVHHNGEVFLNGRSLYEKANLELVKNPMPYQYALNKDASIYTWYCESDDKSTSIWANFHDYNPNKELVEITVRKTCFYPDSPGCNFITIRGFHFSQAATQWAAPTAEQIGLIGTHWSKGWIIENNIISDSKCTGITLGKDRQSGHNVWLGNPRKGGATHYNEVIFRALQGGWSKDKIGSHIVRNNSIFNCEQAGICGSLGAVFSTITNNHIYDIWTKRQFQGAEIGGIKLHAAIDVLIKNNHIHNTGRGLWMDWMAQGTRISANLCYDNTTEDLFFEVDHGPYIVDNNVFLSDVALKDMSEGGAYVHNLVSGKVKLHPSTRYTPYHFSHSTEVAGLINIIGGDDRFYNNIFVAGDAVISPNNDPDSRLKTGYGLDIYNALERPMQVQGNIYLKGAKPYFNEAKYIERKNFDPGIKLVKEGKNYFLHMTLDPSLMKLQNQLVDTNLLGIAMIPELPYENPDGTSLKINKDYFGNNRNNQNPTVGPFENPGEGKLILKLW